MQVFASVSELTSALKIAEKANKSVGFVPTMGALHEGHMALVERALTENDDVVVSIFVNPTQFNTSEDLEKYPRTLTSDLEILTKTAPNCIVFTPTTEEIYGTEVLSDSYHFDGLEHEMEGKFRPGHFDGVGTILSRFFTIISPTRAYFGEKDFQQLQIVRKLVALQQFPITIVGCSISRNAKGLALSSRNKRLSTKQYDEAPLIYQTLLQVKEYFGTKSVSFINDWVAQQFEDHPEFTLEYFYIAGEHDLKPTTQPEKTLNYRAFIAVFAGKVRLIDNIALI